MGTGKVQTSTIKNSAQPAMSKAVNRCLKLKPKRMCYYVKPRSGGRLVNNSKILSAFFTDGGFLKSLHELNRKQEIERRVLANRVISALSAKTIKSASRHDAPPKLIPGNIARPYPEGIPWCIAGFQWYRFLKHAGVRASASPWSLHYGGHWLYSGQSDPSSAEAIKLQQRHDPDKKGSVCSDAECYLEKYNGKEYEVCHHALYYQVPKRKWNEKDIISLEYEHEGHKKMRPSKGAYDPWKYLDATATDVIHIEKVAAPIFESIARFAPKLHDIGRKKYEHVLKILYIGLESGMTEQSYVDVIKDLIGHVPVDSEKDRRFKRNDEIIYKLLAIVSLRFAGMLHHDNLQQGGPGLYDDYDNFLQIAESYVRNNKLLFRQLSKADASTGVLSLHMNSTDTIYFRSLAVDEPPYESVIDAIHELYHGFQDLTELQQARHENEVPTLEVQYKVYALFQKWFRKKAGFDIGDPVCTWRVQRRTEVSRGKHLTYERMGASKKTIECLKKYYAEKLRRRLKIKRLGRDVLEDARNTGMRKAVELFAQRYIFSHLFFGQDRSTYDNMFRLRQKGFAELVALRLRGALRDFLKSKSQLPKTKPLSVDRSTAYYLIFISAQVMRSSLLILGFDEQWNAANERYCESLIPWLENKLLTVPANFDGPSH